MSIQLRILQNLLGVLETSTFNFIQFVDTLKVYLDTIWKHLHFVNPALRGKIAYLFYNTVVALGSPIMPISWMTIFALLVWQSYHKSRKLEVKELHASATCSEV